MTPAGSRALDALVADAAGGGLVLDFDGVLAPIVDDPADSRIDPATAELLTRLVPRLHVVAVLSGRPLAFLRTYVPIKDIHLFGSYGLEDSEHHHQPNGEWAPLVLAAAAHLEQLFDGADGIRIERKSVSVAVHWRGASDRERAHAAVSEAITLVAAETDLRIESGKFVLELRPQTGVDKGTIVTDLVTRESLTTVVYAGDDVGDATAMRAARSAGGHALLVGHGDETPDLLRSLATEVIGDIAAFHSWIATLSDRIG